MKFIAGIVFIISSFSAFSQNLYDSVHTARFANYLYTTRQYEFAAQEYQRLLFFSPTDRKTQYQLVQCYRLSANYQKGIESVNRFFGENKTTMPDSFALEYTKLHLFLHDTEPLSTFLAQNQTLPKPQKEFYQLGILLLDQKYEQASNFAQTCSKDSISMNQLAMSSAKIRYKSPALAAGFSTLFPCSGKIYTRNTKDALLTMLVIASNAYCAYRGFERNGKKSVYGWVSAGLATSFYLGTIYGSYKAAQRYNRKQHETIHTQTYHLLLAD
jgi:tetratricopeptide (TPR) repeat protein